ncbi:MAG: histidine ammonia-lyase [Alphaproteobacteria bacterium]
MAHSIEIDPGKVPIGLWRRILCAPTKVRFGAQAAKAISASQAAVARRVEQGGSIYGVNTGFGRLARVRVDDGQLGQLQRNLLLSHAAGTGPLLDDAVVRLILIMKAAALARGFSGVSPAIIDALLALANGDVLPAIPAQGSVGASGDLAPLAHMACVLIGQGKARYGGKTISAAEGLKIAGLAPVELGPKEALALINGTQVSTALALAGLFAAEDALGWGLITGAMSVDALKGSDGPFDARIHALRGHLGQIDVAAVMRDLVAGSAIRQSHLECDRVQDPYSLRCQPQVMGACLDQLRHGAGVLEIEANAVTDNPLVFADSGDIISGGNFHAEPVALTADGIALALAEIGAISERRQALLVDTSLSGLPAFLVEGSGLNSGFMIAQVTAAALASENKMLAHPASVDSIPTSANQEDHVSMATHGARRLGPMAHNTQTIVALEWLAAAQGLDFHAPLKSSPDLLRAHGTLRAKVPHYDEDRYFADDIAQAQGLLSAGALDEIFPHHLFASTRAQ